MTFAEDQDGVGEVGSDGQDEAFGEAVRSRTSRWDLHGILQPRPMRWLAAGVVATSEADPARLAVPTSITADDIRWLARMHQPARVRSPYAMTTAGPEFASDSFAAVCRRPV